MEVENNHPEWDDQDPRRQTWYVLSYMGMFAFKSLYAGAIPYKHRG